MTLDDNLSEWFGDLPPCRICDKPPSGWVTSDGVHLECHQQYPDVMFGSRNREGGNMSPRYYAALVRAEDGQVMMAPGGPLSTYSDVIDHHSRAAASMATIRPPKYERRVLLDLGSLTPAFGDELRTLLHNDPVLKAVFDLGKQYGMNVMTSLD